MKNIKTLRKGFVMRLLACLIPLLTLLMIPTAPASPQGAIAVEIKNEPHHHAKFENEFVRVWDVTVPAGDVTLWHVHANDNVVVTLGEARLRIETSGGAPAESQWKFGDVRFGKATYVHRAMNVGTTPFHNMTIEILKSTAFFPDLSKLPKQAGREPVFENDRVRAYRLSLAPGESTAVHRHPLPGLAIMLTPGEIEVTTEGKTTPDRLKVATADARWRAGAVTHSIKNVGQTRFEAVDIELK
jgi:quercetin dioxygenase-like cupin family protein